MNAKEFFKQESGKSSALIPIALWGLLTKAVSPSVELNEDQQDFLRQYVYRCPGTTGPLEVAISLAIYANSCKQR